MNRIILLPIIFILMSTNLWAGPSFNTGSIKEAEREINRIKKMYPEGSFDLHKAVVFKDENTCEDCPPFMNLVQKVNDVLAKMDEDPKFINEDFPLEIKKLKMVSLVIKKEFQDGSIRCDQFNKAIFMSNNKMDVKGQAKLINEQVFSYPAATSLLIDNPENKQLIYYMRDPSQQNILIQVVLENNKDAVIRYYSYTPSEKELNPYNLPSMGEELKDLKHRRKKSEGPVAKPYAVETPVTPIDPNASKDKFDVNFDPRLEKHGWRPKDYLIGDVSVQKELLEGYLLRGESKLSLAKGNQANLKLNDGVHDVLVVTLETKLNGKSDHNIVVPYYINLGSKDLPTEIVGTVQDDTNGRSASLSLRDENLEIIRTVIRQNKSTGNNSVIIARDFRLPDASTLGVQAGHDEQSNNFVGVHHEKVYSKSIKAVLDVKLDGQKKASVYYTVSAKF